MSQSGSQNEAIDYAKVIEILKIPFVGSEIEKKSILNEQENVCQQLIAKFKDIDDDEEREISIEAGVTEELTIIIESRDLTTITATIIEALEYLTYPASYEIRQLLFEKKNPYPGLLRLLDHKNSDVVLRAITTIGSILNGGIGSTNDEEQNPHFQSVEECGGIQKLFSLFLTTSIKIIKDRAAVSFGRLFKACAIADKEMQQSIISHLKSITSDADEWARSNSILTINFLAQNEDNYTEIMKGFDPLTVIQDLRLPIAGNEEERKQIQHKKNLDCVLLQLIIYKVEDDNTILENLIEAGIIEALLYLFETQDLNMISSASVKIFDKIQSLAETLIEQLKKEKKYYPSILRLLRSSDLEVLQSVYYLIVIDFAEGADSAKENSPNPLFEEISECGGIEIIFDLFQRNLNYDSKNNSAKLLAMLFMNQEFSSELMRKEIVNYFINPLINSNSDELKIEELSLRFIARIAGNHAEILKDDFIAQAIQVTSNSSESFLLDFLEIIIDAGTEQTREQIKQEFSVAKIKDLYQHKDSNIKEKTQQLMSKINYPEQMKKLEAYQEIVMKNEQNQQINFNIHEMMNDICIALEEACDNYGEKGGLAILGIRIVNGLIINYKEAVQQELEDGMFIEELFKLFKVSFLFGRITKSIIRIIHFLVDISPQVMNLISNEKNISVIIHLLDCKDENVLLNAVHVLYLILLSMNERLQIKQDNQIRDVFEKFGGLIKLIQIFQNNTYQNKLIVQYSIISIGLLHKAVKIPDEIRSAVIHEINQMA
ncbi:MAG: hypothetical protein EZS28_016632, partial [Streblomastix strix]